MCGTETSEARALGRTGRLLGSLRRGPSPLQAQRRRHPTAEESKGPPVAMHLSGKALENSQQGGGLPPLGLIQAALSWTRGAFRGQ